MYSELNKSIRDCTLAQRGTIEDDQKAIVIYNVEMSRGLTSIVVSDMMRRLFVQYLP